MKQIHRQPTKNQPTNLILSASPSSKIGLLTNEEEVNVRKLEEHLRKVQQLVKPAKTLTISIPTVQKGRVIIHCLRHAQAQHNISTIPRTQRLNILDPGLTPHGKIQASALKKTLGASPTITHILCSPLKRTLQTALLGLKPLLSDKQKIIAYPDIREWGSSPCSTGSKTRDLLLEMKQKQEIVDFALVEKGWEVNREDRASLTRKERVRRVKEDLFELGQESLKEMGYWKGREVGRGLRRTANVEIVLVSHAAFLGTLEGSEVERLRNAQWRTYEFASHEEISTTNCSRYDLVETKESKSRNDIVLPSPTEPPTSSQKLNTQKSKDKMKNTSEENGSSLKKLNTRSSKDKLKVVSAEALLTAEKVDSQTTKEKSATKDSLASQRTLLPEKCNCRPKLATEVYPATTTTVESSNLLKGQSIIVGPITCLQVLGATESQTKTTTSLKKDECASPKKQNEPKELESLPPTTNTVTAAQKLTNTKTIDTLKPSNEMAVKISEGTEAQVPKGTLPNAQDAVLSPQKSRVRKEEHPKSSLHSNASPKLDARAITDKASVPNILQLPSTKIAEPEKEKTKTNLQETAGVTPAPKKAPAQNSKEKSQSTDQTPPSPRRIRSERSKEKLKTSSEKNSSPDSRPGSPKKLRAEKSKDKLKVQKKH